MTTPHLQLLDVVALTEDVPALKLLRGQVGTIVETFPDGMVEVEFADENGRTFAQGAFSPDRLLKLYYRPAKVA
jgi:hypothetical protein